MISDDRAKRLRRIQELIEWDYDPKTDFDRVAADMRDLTYAVHEHIAATVTPFVNRRLATEPQGSLSERKELIESVSSVIRRLGLAFRFANNSDEPASLRVARNHNSIQGEFEMNMLDRRSGFKRISCSGKMAEASFFPVSLMPIPERYGLWTDRLQEAKTASNLPPTSPSGSHSRRK